MLFETATYESTDSFYLSDTVKSFFLVQFLARKVNGYQRAKISAESRHHVDSPLVMINKHMYISISIIMAILRDKVQF